MEVLGASVAMAFTDCITSAISQVVSTETNSPIHLLKES